MLLVFFISISISISTAWLFRKSPSPIISRKISFPFQHIRGFYGLIGPEIDTTKSNSLLDLFMGNGIVQGIFIENGTATFIKNNIQTNKLILEDISPFPVMGMGVANTAFLHFKNDTYALFERDSPYLLDINYNTKTVDTVGKYKIEDISHFSAHPKIRYNNIRSYIETIDYDVLRKKTTVYQLDSHFRVLSTVKIPMKYIPMIHDFISTPSSIVMLNSAFAVRRGSLELDRSKPAIFYMVNRENQQEQRYYTDQSMYIFHYADVYETEDNMEIYAPIHYSLDFAKLELKGKYRKIILDKQTKSVQIEKNENLERFDLEFPVPFFHENKKKILLRYVDINTDKTINTGFVICHKLEFETQIDLPGKCICGEPAIISIDETEIPHALFFTTDKNANGFFTILNLVTLEILEIPLFEKLTIGFHSIFLLQK